MRPIGAPVLDSYSCSLWILPLFVIWEGSVDSVRNALGRAPAGERVQVPKVPKSRRRSRLELVTDPTPSGSFSVYRKVSTI